MPMLLPLKVQTGRLFKLRMLCPQTAHAIWVTSLAVDYRLAETLITDDLNLIDNLLTLFLLIQSQIR